VKLYIISKNFSLCSMVNIWLSLLVLFKFVASVWHIHWIFFDSIVLSRMYCVLAGKQKIHYTFTDGSEMVEEYDMRNYDLLGTVIV